MSRKNTARTTARPATSTRKKAVASRRSPETAELTETPLEAAPSAAFETVEAAVVEAAVVEAAVVEAAVVEAAVVEAAVVEAAVVEAAVVEAVATPTRIVARGEFDAIVRREAYLLAEARGFRQGSAFEDWIRAESAVHARLRAEGVSLA